MRSVFKTKADRDYVVEKYGAIEGMKQTLGRLTEHLQAMPADGTLFITRKFDAPRELVWKAWTEADRLAQWWGPKNVTVKVLKQDLKPGGLFHYSMQKPDGGVMWGRFEYRDIVPAERLVFINGFANDKGEIAPNPWMPVWPLEVLNVLTLIEENGETLLTLRAWPINATEAQGKAFVDAQKSMQQGFKGAMDQLDAYLAKA